MAEAAAAVARKAVEREWNKDDEERWKRFEKASMKAREATPPEYYIAIRDKEDEVGFRGQTGQGNFTHFFVPKGTICKVTGPASYDRYDRLRVHLSCEVNGETYVNIPLYYKHLDNADSYYEKLNIGGARRRKQKSSKRRDRRTRKNLHTRRIRKHKQ